MISTINLQEWSSKSIGSIFWLPAFNFPQSFLAAVLLSHSQKNNIAYDRLEFENVVSEFCFVFN